MSQQGRDGLLDEAELSEQIYRFLDLKLDKEALMRPTKDVVIEIYTRFLDKTGYDWRRPRVIGREPIVMAQMLGTLKVTFSRYSIEYEFNIYDIIKPTRRRTVTFLNVILFLLATLDDKLKHLQQWKAQHAVEQQEEDQIKKEIGQKQLAIESLAVELSRSKSKEQMELEFEKHRKAFEAKNKECERIKDETYSFKKASEAIRDNIEIVDKDLQERNKRLHLKGEVEKLLEDQAQLRQKLTNVEIRGSERLGQIRVALSRADNDLKFKKNALIDIDMNAKAEIKDLDDKLMHVKKIREELANRSKQRESQIQEAIERANQKLEAIQSCYENSRSVETKGEAILRTYKEKLETLMGDNKAPPPVETDKNSTFIKSRAFH